MSERLIIFSPLFYIWSLFIAKKLRLLESIYQRLQGEERRGEERTGKLSWEPRLLLEGLLSRVGAAGWRLLRKWKLAISFICVNVVSGEGATERC